MSNRLKNFIYNNRKSFDDETPSDDVWNRIEKSIPAGKNEKRFSIKDIYKWSAAAAVFFIAATSFYFLAIEKKGDDQATISNKNTTGNKPETSSEFDAQVNHFYQAVQQQQEELKSLAAGQPRLYDQFAKDLSTLDSSYRVLRGKSGETPNREIIIKAMLQNLQLQAELLSKQLLIINEIKTQKQEKNEKSTDRNS